MNQRRLIWILVLGLVCSLTGLICTIASWPGGMIFITFGLFLKFFGLFGLLYLILRQKQNRKFKSE